MRKKNQNSNPNVSLIATLSATKTLKSLHNDNTKKNKILFFLFQNNKTSNKNE